ncbi:ribokinase [Streptomyces sp. NPDC054901]
MDKPLSPRVLVIGSVNIDRILRCPALPAPGETVLAAMATTGFGGKGANQAAAASTMGATTHLVAKVGGDTDGLRALANLRGADVVTDTAITDLSAPTGQAVVLVDANGENSIVVAPGANALLSADDVTDALTVLRPRAGDVILTSGEVPQPSIIAAIPFLAAGAQWIHNVAPAATLPPFPTAVRPLLVVNAVEARQITGMRQLAEAAAALAAQGSAAVVTLGADGALIADDHGIFCLPAPTVTTVDSTGAGDVFCGTLAAEIVRGTSLQQAVATAVAAGAFAVTGHGARGALPRPGDLKRLIQH